MLVDSVLDCMESLSRTARDRSSKAVALEYVTRHDQVYDIQQVYDHMWAGVIEGAEAQIDTRDFPSVVPPADAAWFEFTAKWGRRMGALLLVDYDLADDQDWDLCREHNHEWRDMGDEKRAQQRWLIRLIGMVNITDTVGVIPHQAYLYVGYDGTLVGYAAQPIDENDDTLTGYYTLNHIAHTVMTALCFMSARGTVVDRACQQPRPERRRREKAGLKPAIRFNTVNIKPLLVRYRGHQTAPRSGQPFHWVRGNFAKYTEDAPLFGKYVGTVYRPLHAAGSKAEGQVVKTYTVEGP